MKVMVTGGKGFIGSHLVNALNNLDIDTQIVDGKRRVQSLSDDDFYGCSVIFHLAATARLGVSLKTPGDVLDNNISSTLRVLEYCREHPDVRLVYISSSSVKFADLDENPYALSKSVGEQMLRTYVHTYGIKATSVRLFNVYGPGEADYGANTTLVKACKRKMLNGEALRINGSGHSIWRDYTHVSDVVEGLFMIMKEMMSGDHRPMYELGPGKPTTVKRVVEEFQDGTNLFIEHFPARFGDAPLTLANTELWPRNWIPTIDVIDYIREWKALGCPND